MSLEKVRAVLLMLCCATLGCATASVSTSDLDHPILDIQKAVNNQMPSGIASATANLREFTSNYFGYQKGEFEYPIAKPEKERNRAVVTIFGDRRPYSLKVEIQSQRNVAGRWQDQKASQELAKRVSHRILDHLSKTSQKNLVDHFRPF